MDFRLSEEEEAFRGEVEQFLRESLPADWPGPVGMFHEEAVEDIFRMGVEMRRKMAAKGWIGISWPKEYGGGGDSIVKQMILEEALNYRSAPGYDQYSMILAGPLILQFGTEDQKKKFITPITRGEERWSIGMSEPNAGSDLAALETRAVEEDDCYVINGQKTWQSGANHADWCMMYARTNPDVAKHKGITCFLVSLKSPGVTVRKLEQMGGLSILNEVFYDNVRVPKESVLGTVNGGWNVAVSSLSSERTFGVLLVNACRQDLEQLVGYCKETYVDGQPLAKDPIVRNKLGEMAIEVEVGHTLAWRLNWLVATGKSIVIEGSQCRLYGTALAQRVANVGTQILGLYGGLDEDSKWARLRGRMMHSYLLASAAGVWSGTSEMSKNTVAGFGLGLPRG
jgi:alkylation response protein AidB-like acyl-CoA dehydrogenase